MLSGIAYSSGGISSVSSVVSSITKGFGLTLLITAETFFDQAEVDFQGFVELLIDVLERPNIFSNSSFSYISSSV